MEKFDKKSYIIGFIICMLTFGALYLYKRHVKKNIPAGNLPVVSVAAPHRQHKKRKSHVAALQIAPTGAPGASGN